MRVTFNVRDTEYVVALAIQNYKGGCLTYPLLFPFTLCSENVMSL